MKGLVAGELQLMESVYLDTSAWNWTLAFMAGRSRRIFRDVQILISSCVLDEFCLASPGRAQELSSFAWEISARWKLKDHLPLSADEISSHQRGVEYPSLEDTGDPKFHEGWRLLRTGQITKEHKEWVGEQLNEAKKRFRDWLQSLREEFAPLFVQAKTEGLECPWPAYLRELREEGRVSDLITGLLQEFDLVANIPDIDAIIEIDPGGVPATSCWSEYYLAQSYLASRVQGASGKPNRGEQIDFRHAAYAGVVDFFITADARMEEILNEMVFSKRAHVLHPEKWLDGLLTR